jgi:short-subunit dehydrogenase
VSNSRGTKAFLKNWSLGLEMETCSGIKVHYLNTLWVATRMSKIRPSLFFPTPAKYVKSVLGLLGTAEVCITPYFWHFAIDWIIYFIPKSFRLNQMNQMQLQLRARALAKAKRNE